MEKGKMKKYKTVLLLPSLGEEGKAGTDPGFMT